MKRRDVFKFFALPFLPFGNIFGNLDPKVVKFSKYVGPNPIGGPYPKGKNVLDVTWANNVIGDIPGEYFSFGNRNSGSLHGIYRQTVENCILRQDQPEYFTASREPWKENHPWSGDVTLVKDTIFYNNGKIEIEYMLCRGKNAIMHDK